MSKYSVKIMREYFSRFDVELEMEEIKRQKPTLARILDKGYDLGGMFAGYIIMKKDNKYLLYDNINDLIIIDKKYTGNKFIRGLE